MCVCVCVTFFYIVENKFLSLSHEKLFIIYLFIYIYINFTNSIFISINLCFISQIENEIKILFLGSTNLNTKYSKMNYNTCKIN